jgi:hypothetical protein
MRDRRERDAVGRLGAAPFRRHEQTDTKMRVTVERETQLGDSGCPLQEAEVDGHEDARDRHEGDAVGRLCVAPFGRHEQTDTKMRVTVVRETQMGDSVLPPSGGRNRRTRRCA